MAQTIFCDAGCGRPYTLEVGMEGEPVHMWFCSEHFCDFALTLMKTWEQAQLAADGVEPGTEAEGREALAGRSRGRRARPRVMAVDQPDGAVVEDPAATPEATGAEGG